MPLARIRTFDPEAIAFLAAQLASSGYQLQFVRPDENMDEEADLEISVTRMDLPAALKQAQLQAEQLGVEVSIVSGVFAEPVAPEPELQEIESAEPVPAEPPTEQWITPYHYETPEEVPTAEPVEETYSEPIAAPEPSRSSKFREASADTVAAGIEALSAFKRESVRRLEDWKQQIAEKRAERRARQIAEQDDEQVPAPAEVALPQKTARSLNRERVAVLASRYRSFDRRYIRAAIAAAVVVAAGLITWGVAGAGGPADPIGKSQLLNVQQKVPFGAASVSAPVTPASVQPAIVPVRHLAQPQARTEKPRATRPVAKPRTVSVHKRKRAERNAAVNDEVVVRHFNAKPVSQQAKTTTRNGVKIISEE